MKFNAFKNRNKRAFTLIEVMVVIVVFMIGLGLVLLFAQSAQLRTDVNTQVNTIAATLRLAQSQSISGEGGSAHGVHLETTQYVLFSGSTYSVGSSSNKVMELPETIEIQNINLSGGGQDIVFESPGGTTTNFGTFDIVAPSTGQFMTLTITSLGSISY